MQNLKLQFIVVNYKPTLTTQCMKTSFYVVMEITKITSLD